MKVKLLTDGNYTGAEAIVGKVFNAVFDMGSFDITVPELITQGFIPDGSEQSTLCWFSGEVEVVEE
jgi:hypothetical protein